MVPTTTASAAPGSDNQDSGPGSKYTTRSAATAATTRIGAATIA